MDCRGRLASSAERDTVAHVDFYEKTGCINNTRQKLLLIEAGHRVYAHNLLTEPWTKARLLAFFGELAVPDWFNRSAPRVTSGEVVPELCSAEQALALMVKDPLLIRRPLMAVGESRKVGFDPTQVMEWIGLVGEADTEGDLESCPRKGAYSECNTS